MKKFLCFSLVVLLMVGIMPISALEANGLTTEEWNDFWGTVAIDENGYMNMFADASSKNPYNPNYVKVEVEFKHFLADPADTWIAMALVKDPNNRLDVTSGTPAGLLLDMQNNGGKLQIAVRKNGSENNLINETLLENVALPGTVEFVFQRDDVNNTWNLYINGEKVNADNSSFESLQVADIVDESGKTYVAFAAFSVSDAPTSRVWAVKGITNEEPVVDSPTPAPIDEPVETSPVTGDNLPVFILVFCLTSLLLVITYKGFAKKTVRNS